MTQSTAHGSFTVERDFPYPPERVFAAWTTAEAKSAWFAQGENEFVDRNEEYSLDFREGGLERLVARLQSGKKMVLETRFYDIVSNERIVATYDILIDDRRLSVSVWSAQFIATDEGTK